MSVRGRAHDTRLGQMVESKVKSTNLTMLNPLEGVTLSVTLELPGLNLDQNGIKTGLNLVKKWTKKRSKTGTRNGAKLD